MNISLMSIADGRIRTLWHLSQVPEFMAVLSPSELRIVSTADGPVIVLHGCARHLCGGEGLAGALTYAINERRMYTAYANAIWSDGKETVEIVYSPHEPGPKFEVQKRLLDGMLREENYNP
jgi:hypothetical protein